jgi:hypothetical protein
MLPAGQNLPAVDGSPGIPPGRPLPPCDCDPARLEEVLAYPRRHPGEDRDHDWRYCPDCRAMWIDGRKTDIEWVAVSEDYRPDGGH